MDGGGRVSSRSGNRGRGRDGQEMDVEGNFFGSKTAGDGCSLPVLRVLWLFVGFGGGEGSGVRRLIRRNIGAREVSVLFVRW